MTPSTSLVHLTLTGVELTNELSISLPLAVILVAVVMFVGRNAWQGNQNATEIAALKAKVEALSGTTSSQDNRLTRVETTILHIQATTDKTQQTADKTLALVQAMAGSRVAA